MMRIFFLLFFVLLFGDFNLKAQQITFKINYGFLNMERGNYIEQTMDGGYISEGSRAAGDLPQAGQHHHPGENRETACSHAHGRRPG
mgnify:CR=1 FL=1